MTCLATSFLCAPCVPQSTSARAIAYAGGLTAPLESTSLLFYEFRQSLQFQVFRHSKDRNQGYPLSVAQAASTALQSDVKAGFYLHAGGCKICSVKGFSLALRALWGAAE